MTPRCILLIHRVLFGLLAFVLGGLTVLAVDPEPDRQWQFTDFPCPILSQSCIQGATPCSGFGDAVQRDTWMQGNFHQWKTGSRIAPSMQRLCMVEYPCIFHPLKQQCIVNEQGPALQHITGFASHTLKQ